MTTKYRLTSLSAENCAVEILVFFFSIKNPPFINFASSKDKKKKYGQKKQSQKKTVFLHFCSRHIHFCVANANT